MAAFRPWPAEKRAEREAALAAASRRRAPRRRRSKRACSSAEGERAARARLAAGGASRVPSGIAIGANGREALVEHGRARARADEADEDSGIEDNDDDDAPPPLEDSMGRRLNSFSATAAA